MKAILLFSFAEFGNHIHNFLTDEAKKLKERFGEVHVICGETKLPFDKNVFGDNVKVHMFSKTALLFQSMKFVTLFNNPIIKQDRAMIKKHGKYSKDYYIHSAKVWAYSEVMLNIISGIIKETNPEEFFIESYWLDGGALAVAKAKAIYPNVKTIARAHSVEIDPIKNKYCYFEYKEFIDNNIDKIVFISKAGLVFYEEQIRTKFSSYNANLRYIRLGSKKIFEGVNPGSNDGMFRILSCSRVEPVKRVSLIANALKCINSDSIKWFHIGIGSETDNLQKEIKSFPDKIRSNITLLGDFTPRDVQKYLCEQPIDLFINVSSSEGVPVSIMEAQAYGIPVMATDCGGTKEIVDEKCGELIKVDISVEELGDKISEFQKIYKDSFVSYNNMRSDAYKTWVYKYNQDVCFEEFLKFALE